MTLHFGDDMIHYIKPDLFAAYLIFPFAFDNEEIDVNKLSEDYHKTEKKGWEIIPYEKKYGQDYNEYVYFYPYVRKILFLNDDFNRTNGFYYLRWNKNDRIHKLKVYPANSEKNVLSIEIIDIYLHLYDLGVGILIFEIRSEKNVKYSLRDFIQLLNLARRLYPPFIKADAKLEEKQTVDSISSVKFEECPLQTEIWSKDKLIVRHDFVEDNKWESENEQIPTLNNIITHFLDIKNKRITFRNKDKNYRPIVDDRMFVHSFYRLPQQESLGNRGFIEHLKSYFGNPEERRYDLKALDFWYQMIFLDKAEPSCKNPVMQKQILNEATYKRWSDANTFYGYSRFSSVMLVTCLNFENANNKDDFSWVLFSHFNSMYYQIAVLLFFYRGVLLSFSERSAKIAELFMKKSSGRVFAKLSKLRKEFLLFRNRYWFKEVTAQDQGIDIFNQWSNQLNNFNLMEDIKSEIHELYNFANYQNEKKENHFLKWLSVLGGIALPLTVATGFLGMNLFNETSVKSLKISDIIKFSEGWQYFWGIFALLITPVIIVSIYNFFRKE